jgi:uncharacterized membrane protein YphA (DoxX/SURF4 family)
MMRPRALLGHARILAPIVVVAVVAAHLLVLGFATRHFALPGAVLLAVLGLWLLAHLRLLVPIWSWLRRRR